MTRGELNFLEKWYEEDKEWKRSIEVRIGKLEDRFVAIDAVEAMKQQQKEDSNTKMGVIGGIIGAVVTAIAQLLFMNNGGNGQ